MKEFSMRRVIEDFGNYLRYEKEYPEGRVRTYQDTVARYISYLRQKHGETSRERIKNPRIIEEFVKSESINIKDETREAKSSALNEFARFIETYGRLSWFVARYQNFKNRPIVIIMLALIALFFATLEFEPLVCKAVSLCLISDPVPIIVAPAPTPFSTSIPIPLPTPALEASIYDGLVREEGTNFSLWVPPGFFNYRLLEESGLDHPLLKHPEQFSVLLQSITEFSGTDGDEEYSLEFLAVPLGELNEHSLVDTRFITVINLSLEPAFKSRQEALSMALLIRSALIILPIIIDDDPELYLANLGEVIDYGAHLGVYPQFYYLLKNPPSWSELSFSEVAIFFTTNDTNLVLIAYSGQGITEEPLSSLVLRSAQTLQYYAPDYILEAQD